MRQVCACSTQNELALVFDAGGTSSTSAVHGAVADNRTAPICERHPLGGGTDWHPNGNLECASDPGMDVCTLVSLVRTIESNL